MYLTQTPDVRLEVHSEAQTFGAVYNESGLHTAEPRWVHLSFVINTLTGRDQCYVNGRFFSERNRTQFLTPVAPGRWRDILAHRRRRDIQLSLTATVLQCHYTARVFSLLTRYDPLKLRLSPHTLTTTADWFGFRRDTHLGARARWACG